MRAWYRRLRPLQSRLRKKAAQDFLTRFAQFKDRAGIEGQTLGVLIDPPGYQFMQRHHGQWLPVSVTRLSAQVTVPKQVQMLLQPGSDIWQKEYALELQTSSPDAARY